MTDDLTSHNRAARNVAILVTTIGTLLIELFTLYAWASVFTGSWLGDYVLTGLFERVGLVALLTVYALAASGLVIGIAAPLFRLVFRASPARAVWTASFLWLIGLIVVSFVKMRVGEYLGAAFDLDLVEGFGQGSIGAALQYAVMWFWAEALISTIVFVVLLIVAVKTTKWLRNADLSETRVGRLPSRVARIAVIGAVLFTLLDIMVFGTFWPSVSWAAGRSTIGASTKIVVTKLTDVDGDGVSAFSAPPDKAPFDASRHPYAIDTPDDGIDSNGWIGDLRREDLPPDLMARVDSRAHYPPVQFKQRRNVIFISLESFRAGLVGSSANGREITPFMSKLIADGEALEVGPAWATSSFTAPALTQTFWGGLARHGPTMFADFHDDNGYWFGVASGQEEDMADMALESDYYKADFFEDCHDDDPKFVLGGERSGDRVMLSIDHFLESRPKDKPFFLYVNLQDCHFPYTIANPSIIWDDLPAYTSLARSNAPMLRRFFQNQAANVDRQIRALSERLKAQGVWEETILVLVADHGESIYEDGVLGHGLRLTDTQTKVTCLFVHPTTDVPAPYVHVDLRGTLRHMLTVEEPTANPKVAIDADRRVLQMVGDYQSPRRLCHVDDGPRPERFGTLARRGSGGSP